MDIDYDFLGDTLLYSIPGYPEFGINHYSGMSQQELENEVKAALLRLKKSRIFYKNNGYIVNGFSNS